MEIKVNKLIISIPKGMEIDTENSNFAEGIIMFKPKFKFKPKYITYDDIVNSFNSTACINAFVHSDNMNKLRAMAQLMNIAKYYNGDWKPEWNNRDEDKNYIYYGYIQDEYYISETNTYNSGIAYFKNKEYAMAVIDNPNFRPILDAIYKNE